MSKLEQSIAALTYASDRLTPEVLEEFLRMLSTVPDIAVPKAAVEALARGDIVKAIDVMMTVPEMAAVRSRMRGATARSFVRAGAYESRLIVSGDLKRGPFVTTDPQAIQQVGKVIDMLDNIVPFLREGNPFANDSGFRAAIKANIAKGLNPRAAIEQARHFIPLTAQDHAIWSSYELDLRAGNYTDALRRKLRGTEYDTLIRELRSNGGMLSESRIREMRDAYVENLVSMRAEAWARTATLNASRMAKWTAYQQSAERAGIPLSMLEKKWVTTLDGRERPEHHDMHGVVVGFAELWAVDGGVLVPSAWNCRCGFTVRTKQKGDPTRLTGR